MEIEVGVRSALRIYDLCEIDIPDLNLNQQCLFKKNERSKCDLMKYIVKSIISKLRQSIFKKPYREIVPQTLMMSSKCSFRKNKRREKRLIKGR